MNVDPLSARLGLRGQGKVLIQSCILGASPGDAMRNATRPISGEAWRNAVQQRTIRSAKLVLIEDEDEQAAYFYKRGPEFTAIINGNSRESLTGGDATDKTTSKYLLAPLRLQFSCCNRN